jgi:hypothetical protein
MASGTRSSQMAVGSRWKDEFNDLGGSCASGCDSRNDTSNVSSTAQLSNAITGDEHGNA